MIRRRNRRRIANAMLIAFLCAVMAMPTFVSAASFKPAEGKTLTTLEENKIAPGVSEKFATTVDHDGKNQNRTFIATADLNRGTVGILAGYNEYDSSGSWKMQTVRDQAKAAEKKKNKNIVFAINGDYYNMNTGEPLGALVMDGKIVHERNGEPYFAITKSGKPVIRGAEITLDDCQMAVGGPYLLVENGDLNAIAQSSKGADILPRCGVGITADNKVKFFTNDGRQAPTSVGMDLYEFAQVMKNEGCVTAMYLDGGGSATFASKSSGEEEMTVKNSPSDGGERKVSSSIFVYSDAVSTGNLDQVDVTPKAKVYTPDSEIDFDGRGADESGKPVELPGDGKFKLKDASMGSINESTGLFKSNGKTGSVEVYYEHNGANLGSASVDIQKPDSISFLNEEIALDRDKDYDANDLGLIVRWDNKSVIYKDGDFEWTPENEEVGSFSGNKFHSNSESKEGMVTCKYKDSNVKGSIKIIVGMEPVVVMDFEDYRDESTGEVTSARDYWTIGRANLLADGTIKEYIDSEGNLIEGTVDSRLITGRYINYDGTDRGGNESAEIVNLSDDEPVRFGAHSLKLNYDFTNNGGSTSEEAKAIDGACVGFANETQPITGTPTAIGMYVYAPEDTLNLWLRIRFKDGNGSIVTADFKPGTAPGINWTGWQYCEIDLTPYKAPFSLIGGETIRPMYHAGHDPYHYGTETNEGKPVPKSQRKGSIYIDNLQFVYGTNSADVDNPTFGTITANGTELNDDTVITSNRVNVSASTSDVQNKNTSGIDATAAFAYVDGKQYKSATFVDDQFRINDLRLSDGEHTVSFVIKDKAGNESKKSITFTVKKQDDDVPGDGGLDIPKIKIEAGTAVLGSYTDINFTAKDVSTVKEFNTTVQLGKSFKDYKVKYGEGFEEAKAPVYSKKNNSVTISAKKTNASTETGSEDKVIVTLSVMVPDSMAEDAKFEYKVTSGEVVVSGPNDSEDSGTFTTKSRSEDIHAKISVSSSVMLEGCDAVFTVVDLDGDPIKKADLYLVRGDGNDEKIGTTGNNGTATVEAFRNPGKYKVYAKTDEARSFISEFITYETKGDEDGKPTDVVINAKDKSDTSKNITWISNPSDARKKAIVKLATKADYTKDKEGALKEVEGTSKLLKFSGEATYVNTVIPTDLKPGTEYVFVAGDGKHWSDLRSFKTTYPGQDLNILLIGDTQAISEEGRVQTIDALSAATKNKTNYDLLIQTGDFVETGNAWFDWSNILGAFDVEAIRPIDRLHVTGNHELFGNFSGSVTKALSGIEDIDHYSMTYGNTYIAVIGYKETEKGIKANAEWLAEDAAKSNAKWKIVTMHQPPYGTNIDDKTAKHVNKYFPEACDKGGIDFMFSGHDHSYARTKAMKGGEVTKDGTVYFVCGSTGEKSYSVTENDKYNFVKATNDYKGLYFNLETTADSFKITAYEKDGSVFDTYTKEEESCSLHNYTLTRDNHLICDKCGTSRIADGYNGIITREDTGAIQYIKGNNPITNQWFSIGKKYYYFDKDGNAATGKQKIDGKEYTFSDEGLFIKGSFVKEKVKGTETVNGKKKTVTKTITRYYTAGGVFAVRWVEIDGDMYYFKKLTNKDTNFEGQMYTGDGVTPMLVKTVGNNRNRYYTFGPDGKLVVGAFDVESNNSEGIKVRYYWGDDYIKDTTQTIEGYTYTFDKDGYIPIYDLSDKNIKATVSDTTYTGKKRTPTVVVKLGDAKLVSGKNFKIDKWSNNTNMGTKTASVTISGKPDRGFTGSKTIKFTIKPATPKIKVKAKKKSAIISWKKVTGASGYIVYRSTNNKTFKVVKTVKGNKKLSYKNTKLKSKKKYYYKVVAYKDLKTGKTKRIKGSASKVVSVKAK